MNKLKPIEILYHLLELLWKNNKFYIFVYKFSSILIENIEEISLKKDLINCYSSDVTIKKTTNQHIKNHT